jgi:hypothetical protein
MQLRLDRLQLRTHLISARLSQEQKAPVARFLADVDEAPNVNVSGFPNPQLFRRVAAYRPNSSKRVFSG